MKKMSVTTTLALLLVLIVGSTVAYAAFHWCPDDPILSIGGTKVRVIIEIPEGTQDLVNGPVQVKVYVPSNVETYVIETGDGFNGKGERVTIVPNGEPVEPGEDIAVEVEVRVSTNDSEGFPVRVTIRAPGTKERTEGWSNTWVECAVELKVKK